MVLCSSSSLKREAKGVSRSKPSEKGIFFTLESSTKSLESEFEMDRSYMNLEKESSLFPLFSKGFFLSVDFISRKSVFETKKLS